MSGLIHLWDVLAHNNESKVWTKCGLRLSKPRNVLYASTAERLKIPPNAVCKVCYRLGPPWLGEVK
jgi:hypothetical protein